MPAITPDDLREALEEVVDLGGAEVRPDSIFGEDLPVDSRDMFRILSRLEKKCRVRFPPAEVIKLRTMADLLALTNRLAGATDGKATAETADERG